MNELKIADPRTCHGWQKNVLSCALYPSNIVKCFSTTVCVRPSDLLSLGIGYKQEKDDLIQKLFFY